MALRLPRGRGPGTLAIVVVAWLAAGCAVTGETGPASGSADPSVSPEVATSVPDSADPTAKPAATATADASAPAGQPPPATLAAEGGDAVVGQLGSYTWLGGGSDSPWLPGAPISVGAAEPLTVAIGGGVAVTDWSVRRASAGATDGSGAVSLGAGGGPPVTFVAPAPGNWSAQVVVRFGNDLGSATYYWQLTVR